MFIITLLTSILIPIAFLQAELWLNYPRLTAKEENKTSKSEIRKHVRVPRRQVLLLLRRLYVHHPHTWSGRELFDRSRSFSPASPSQEHDLADYQPVRSGSSGVPFWLHRRCELQHGRLRQHRWSPRSLLLAGFHQHSHWTGVHWNFDCHGYHYTYWDFEERDCSTEQDVWKNRSLCAFR